MLRLLVVLALAALSVAIPTAGVFAPEFVVDPFTTPQKEVLLYTRPEAQTTSASIKNNTILGGQRDITISFVSGTSNLIIAAGVNTGGSF